MTIRNNSVFNITDNIDFKYFDLYFYVYDFYDLWAGRSLASSFNSAGIKLEIWTTAI